MCGGGCAWWGWGGMCGWACVTGGHAWWGHVWWGACMVGAQADTTRYGDAVNERTVRILLECILVEKL